MDNVALDVIIGLVFIYLLFSILLTSLSEMLFNHGMGLRGKNLNVAIKSAFGAADGRDHAADELVERFYAHGLIASLHEGTRTPSEIPADMFSKAFLAVLGNYSGPADRPATPAELVNKLDRDSHLPNRERVVGVLKQLLPGAETSWENYERNVANWFAQVGDRSKGWYKRKLDRRLLLLALGLAIIGNVDTLFIMRMLQLDQQHRELLTSQAANVFDQAEGKPAMAIAAPVSAEVRRMELRDQVDSILVAALVGLRNSILDSVPLRSALFDRCLKKEGASGQGCEFNPYKWYEDLDELRSASWNALSPAARSEYTGTGGRGPETPTTAPKVSTPPKTAPEVADGLRRLSSKLYLAYPDPVRKEDAVIQKQLTALRPAIDKAAQLLQRQLDYENEQAEGAQRICGKYMAGSYNRKECVRRFESAIAGKLGFPIGWSNDLREFQKDSVIQEWSTTVFGVWISAENLLGLALTTLALMLGAPFWFDVLRRVVSLRAAGPRRDDGLSAGTDQGKGAPPVLAGGGGPAGGGAPHAGGGWFADAVNDVERRLSAEQIGQIQSRLEQVPISGRLDAATRAGIFNWRQRHRPGAEDSWELDESMVRELLWQTPDPLLRDVSVLPSTTVLPESDGPLPDLKLGSQGPDVSRLRGLLAAEGFAGVPASAGDNFDAELERAVKEFQTARGLAVDGVVGPSTWLKLTNDPDRLPPAFGTPIWMRYAIHEIGVTEMASAERDNPRIGEYQREIAATPDDEIPWCSAFANWVTKRAGVESSGSAVASSWRECGIDTAARYGAVIVLLQVGKADPGKDGSGAHVGFLIRETADRYIVLGGNQGKEGAGSVCLTAFPKHSWRCLAMRWPKQRSDVAASRQSQSASLDDIDLAVTPTRFVAEPLTEPMLEFGSGDRTAVARLQTKLNEWLKTSQQITVPTRIDVDGIFGEQTRSAVIDFQRSKNLPVSGVVDPATWFLLLQPSVSASSGGGATGGSANSSGPQPLTRGDILKVITTSGVKLELEMVLAVLRVESSGRGFVDGKPVVRLEGHKLWEYAEKLGASPASWTDVGFGLLHKERTGRFVRKGSAEWDRLEQARKLCEQMLKSGVPNNKFGVQKPGELADIATSWGLFQIMGFNYKLCGAASVAEFVRKMNTSEVEQLEVFFDFLKGRTGALEALRERRWGDFASIYNGSGYRENAYDTKLERAYEEARLRKT